jgi:hypothetical protein
VNLHKVIKCVQCKYMSTCIVFIWQHQTRFALNKYRIKVDQISKTLRVNKYKAHEWKVWDWVGCEIRYLNYMIESVCNKINLFATDAPSGAFRAKSSTWEFVGYNRAVCPKPINSPRNSTRIWSFKTPILCPDILKSSIFSLFNFKLSYPS